MSRLDYQRYETIREALGAIVWPEGSHYGGCEAVCLVLEELKVTPTEWWTLDEKPGQFSDRDAWHWKIRRTRNHVPASRLSKALGAKSP